MHSKKKTPWYGNPQVVAFGVSLVVLTLVSTLLWLSCFAVTDFNMDVKYYDGSTNVCTVETEEDDCDMQNCFHCDEEAGRCEDDDSRQAKDNDGDTYFICEDDGVHGTGLDCDDSEIGIHPNADEVCNLADDDCDDSIDEDVFVAKGVGQVEIGDGKYPAVSYGKSNTALLWQLDDGVNAKRIKFAYLLESGSIDGSNWWYLTNGGETVFNMEGPSLMYKEGSSDGRVFGAAWIDRLGKQSGRFERIMPSTGLPITGGGAFFTDTEAAELPSDPQVAAAPSYFAVAWTQGGSDPSSNEVFVTFFNAADGSFYEEWGRINVSNSIDIESSQPCIIFAGSGFVIAWVETESEDNSDINIAYFNVSSGAFTGDTVTIPIPQSAAANPVLGREHDSSGSTSVVLAYEAIPVGDTREEIFAVFLGFDSFESGDIVQGEGEDPTIQVSNASGVSATPSVFWWNNAMGVAWRDERSGSKEVYFRRLSASGVVASDEIALGEGRDPSVVSLGTDNKFAVVWWDPLTTKIYYRAVGCE